MTWLLESEFQSSNPQSKAEPRDIQKLGDWSVGK